MVTGQADIEEPPLPSLAKGETLSAGLLIREPDGRVWVVKPKGGFGGYDYTFPKGGVSKGLGTQPTAIKEAYEETGLHAQITGYAGDHTGDTSITRYYFAERTGGTPVDHGWESEGVSLIHPDQLHEFLNRTRDRKIAHEHLGSPSPHKPASTELKLSSLKKIGSQLGSNPGGKYEDAAGKKFYVKVSKSPDHAKNENLAARLYAALGAPCVQNRLVDAGDGKLGTATEWVKTEAFDPHDEKQIKSVRENFAAHALLANWDAVGLENDNQVLIDGKMTTIDPGGSLLYRAQGSPKGAAFGDKVGEWDTMRDPSKGPTTGPFRKMTESEMKSSAERVAKVPASTLTDLVMKYGPGTPTQRTALADKIVARREDLLKRAGLH
jgi:8-oxo-dGTP pyrophosphatase MutT (NUDIX family)